MTDHGRVDATYWKYPVSRDECVIGAGRNDDILHAGCRRKVIDEYTGPNAGWSAPLKLPW